VNDFWHYGKVARYDLAAASGQQILASGADPVQVLEAFEKVVQEPMQFGGQKDNMDEWMLRWAQLEPMKDVTTKLQAVINEGYLSRKSNADFIRMQIERLSINQRAKASALVKLRQSGELAVPFMIDYLRDPSKAQHHAAIRVALRDLGKYALNPLVAATYSNDPNLLIAVVGVLGDIGYDSSIPYLARIVNDPQQQPAVKDAAGRALANLNRSGGTVSVADAFYGLAEKQYYGNSSIASDTRNPMAFVWYWDNAKGLYKIDVPHAIFNDIMTMRQSEASLKAGASQNNSLSLWLTANYKRQVTLGADQKDMTRPENYPDANYWGVTAGAQYLNESLARGLRDRDSAVSLSVINSLQQIVGQSNMLEADASPLIDAMAFPDRLVRFEAAFAIAGALPQKQFTGQDRVVPLLAEALSQSGQMSVVVVLPTQEAVNARVEGLKTNAGVSAGGSTTAEGAIDQANAMAAVDAIIVSDDMTAAEIDKLMSLAGSNPKLQGAAKIVIVKTDASPYMARAANEPSLMATKVVDPAGFKTIIPEALKKAGTMGLTPDLATQYATRAAEHLKRLAFSRGQVLDISAAKVAMLNALNDARPDIVKLSGQAIALLNDKEAQAALLAHATDEKTADDVKISLYNSLATSAKFNGNLLDDAGVATLSKTVADAQNLQVRSAAAEARGALNLPADQAKQLVTAQSRN
jgi:HEAT repeat protein